MTDTQSSTQEQGFDDWGRFNYGGHYKDRGREAWDHQQAIIDDLVIRKDCNGALAKARLEALQSQWIPCSERLPEDTGNYLVWQKGSGESFADVSWFSGDSEFGCKFYYDISHWMPLPTPPEQE